MRVKALVSLAFVLMLCIAPIPVSANGNTLADEGSAGPDSSTGDYTDTWTYPTGEYHGLKTTSGEAYVILNFSIAPDNILNSLNYSINGGSYHDDDGAGEFWIYDWSADDWVFFDDFGFGAAIWANGSLSGSQYSEDSKITIKINSTDSDGSAGVAVVTAWLHNIDSEFKEWHEMEPAEFYIDVVYWGWHELAPAIFWIIIPSYDPWAFHGWLIMLGLFMIPASLLYLVHGGREKLTSKKFFYFLMIFFVGISFFVGGIMP